MAGMHQNQIDRDIASKEFHRSYLITGDESFLRKNNRDRLLKALVTPGDDLNFTKFSGKEADAGKIIDLAETLPFMAEYRVIQVEDSGFFNRSEDKLADYLKNVSETTILIFNESEVKRTYKSTKAILSDGCMVDCSKPGEDVMQSWILNRIKKAGIQITGDAWRELYSRAGSSMDLLANETEKLITYSAEKGTITLEDVNEVTSGISEEQIFSMLNAIAEKNLNQVMEYYQVLLENRADPIYILGTIQTIFRQMLYMKEMAEKHFDVATIAKEFDKKEWAVRKNLGLAKSYTIPEMKEFLRYVGKMDTASKTGRMDGRTALESVFLRYCR